MQMTIKTNNKITIKIKTSTEQKIQHAVTNMINN